MDDEVPSFTSSEDEARYWRSLARDLQDQLTASKDDLDTLHESSKDLADELLLLEKDLTERERKESEFVAQIQRLQAEMQDAKSKYTAALRDHANTLSHMQRELEQVRSSEQSFRTRIRDMELDNDDLEKAERALTGTLADLESRYNRSLERCAMLEEELVLSARLAEDVQRYKDELRDANEELAIVREQLASLPRAPSRPLTPPGPGARGLPGGVAETALTPSNDPEDEMERLDIDTPKRGDASQLNSISINQSGPAQRKWTPYKSMIPATAQRVPASPEILDNMASALLSSTNRPPSDDGKIFGLPRSVTSRNLAMVNGSTPPSLVRSTSGLPQIKRSTPKSVREERAQGVIKDLKSMTDRIKMLKARVDTRTSRQSIGSAQTSSGHGGVSASGSNLPRLRRASNVFGNSGNMTRPTQTQRSAFVSPGSLEDELTRAVSPSSRSSQIRRPPSRLSIMTSASESSTSQHRPTTPHRRPTTPASSSSFLARLKAEQPGKARPPLSARTTSMSVSKSTSPTKKRLSMQGPPLPRESVEVRRPASRIDRRQDNDEERW